jgi:translation initiation factor 1
MKKKPLYSNSKSAQEPAYRLAYSTDPIPEKKCTQCQQVISKCSCKSKAIGAINPAVRIEKKGRGGKVVTVLYRLPADNTFLKDLCAYLKSKVGSGGTHYVKEDEGIVEIQGDWQKEIIDLALKYKV